MPRVTTPVAIAIVACTLTIYVASPLASQSFSCESSATGVSPVQGSGHGQNARGTREATVDTRPQSKAGEQDGPFVLKAGDLTARLSRNEGRLISLAVGDRQLLSAPGDVLLQLGTDEPVPLGKSFQGFRVAKQKGVLVVEGREPHSGVAVRVEWMADRDFECRATLTNAKGPRLEASVALRLPVAKQKLSVLAPSVADREEIDFSRSLRFSFRGSGRGLVMPAVVLYRPDEDWGLTAMADFKLPTRGFELAAAGDPPTITLSRVHLRLEPARPVTVSMILFAHEGDWRPGLARVVERHSEFFVVADERVPKLHGAFVCSGGAPSDQTIADWKSQHVQTVEVHGTLPFYGQHLPLGKEWTIFADDQWHRLRQLDDPEKPADDAPWKTVHAYVTRKRPPNISVEKINDYIRRLHARGIYAIMYFNPTESWKLWITENYPDDLVRNGAGNYCRTWYESYMVCPNPDSPWGKHLLGEFEKMMDLYPEADGFFMDQSCYDNLDYAHDDGLSIFNGRTGYRMGWAINQISRRCRKMAKARGKFMWWNGPYNVDIARYAEGMMAEAGNEPQVRAIHYLTMGGRACCTLSRKDEGTFQNCAAYGLYPTAMPTPQLRRLATRYWPLFDHFRGKRWVLTAHALELPEATKGNIYRLPDGNVLVVAVSANRSIDGEAFDLGAPLTVRLADAAQFRAAYFISPDLLGKRRLAIRREGNTLRIDLPRHRSVSAVLLAKTGVHGSLEGPFGVVVGQTAKAEFVIDNWTDQPVAGQWTAPEGKNEPLTIAPGKSARRAVSLTAPAERQALRESVVCSAKLEGKTCGGPLEFYVDRPLSAEIELPEICYQDKAITMRVHVFNARAARQVRVALSADGVRPEPAAQAVAIPAGAKRAVEFRVAPVRPGLAGVGARVEAENDRAEVRAECEVYATWASPAAFGSIRSARLVFDSFGSSHGQYKNKPVSINGVRIGVVPGQGDAWEHVEMILSREAVNSIREHNELKIENPPGDDFKVARFRLRLTMRDGSYLLSQLNPGVFSARVSWLHGEGTGFKDGKLVTAIHVPVDPDSKQTYEDKIGEPVSGELVMELSGADGGPYAKKPVTFNGVALGELPTSPDGWTERTLSLTPAALGLLGYVNEVVIKNSRPRDAFKIRRLHIRLKVEGGKTVTSEVDPGVYSSLPWAHAEGKIGCPIVVPLRFAR